MPERRFLQPRKAIYKRRTNHFEPRQRLLIICEGEKTEPNYFRKFPLPPGSVVDVRGIGENTVSLIREAIQLRDQSDFYYDQVWCVFDRDSFPVENFNNAMQIAQDNHIKVAYSNEAFELWYVLHFDYLHTGISRRNYITRLRRLLGHRYLKNSETIYDEIIARQEDAIRNAKRLLAQYDPPKPAEDNPSTTVHILVELLNRLFWD
jgi:hypothetical protein